MSEPSTPSPNGKIQLLSTLANSPDKWVQLGTLALVALSGVTSTIQGAHISNETIEARDRAVRQINILYDRITEFEGRQLKLINANTEIIDSNSKQLANQGDMLRNQQETLKILREEREHDINRILSDIDSIKKKLWSTDHP